MSEDDRIIETVGDAVKKIDQCDFSKHEWFTHLNRVKPALWFRGEAEQYPAKLCPTVFRKAKLNDKLHEACEDERRALLTWMNECFGFGQHYFDSFDWMCLGQHLGLPTRLLDFSRNLLIALYFATEYSGKKRQKDGYLYVLNASRLNGLSMQMDGILTQNEFSTIIRTELVGQSDIEQLVFQLKKHFSTKFIKEYLRALIERDKKWYPELSFPKGSSVTEILMDLGDPKKTNSFPSICSPIAVFPRYSNDRIKRQSGTFVLFGGGLISMIFFPPEYLDDFNEKFHVYEEFKIPNKQKEPIRRELELMGINRASIFPEPEAAARYIADQFKLL